MAKVWVLDTETKGTGAEMVPIEKAKQPAAGRGVVVVEPKRERPPAPPKPRVPRRFKVVDVMTRLPLAEDVDLREAASVLSTTRSMVDVDVHVWDADAGRWQPLTLDERRRLWDFAHSPQ
jgi:hypothetical protein